MPLIKKRSNRYELSLLALWSSLEHQLVACGQTKGTPQQWIGTIRNLQNKGVSEVEIEWSMIIVTLEQHAAPILGIDELLDFLRDAPPCQLVLQRHITDEYLPFVHYEKQQRPTKVQPNWFRHGRQEARILHYRDRTFGLCIWLHTEFQPGLFGRHSYWSLSVPRGRKKLAPDPIGRDFTSPQEAMAYGRTLVERMARRLAQAGFVGQTKGVNKFPAYVLPGGERYTEWLITIPHFPAEYWGPHFELPNIVAHVRTTERTISTGDKLLVLEEIQSDWNQQLREAIQEARARNPSDVDDVELIEWDEDLNPPPFNPYRNNWLEAALRMMLVLAANEGFAGMAWLPGQLHAERFPWANADGLKTFYDRIVPSAVEKLAKSWGAKLANAQFPTLSRCFAVRQLTKTREWVVINRESGQFAGEPVANRQLAEDYRKSIETTVLETVPALIFSDEMRSDIRANGLPYLGAVGKRLGALRSEGDAKARGKADCVGAVQPNMIEAPN